MDRVIPLSWFTPANTGHADEKSHFSVVRGLNEAMGWQPRDALHVDKLDNVSFDVLIKAMAAKKSWSSLREADGTPKVEKCMAYLGKVAGLHTIWHRIDRGIPYEDRGVVNTKFSTNKAAYGKPSGEKMKTFDHVNDRWEKVQERLADITADPGPCGVIATIYVYGYVLRIGEIINTTIEDDGVHNHLNLFTGTWNIRMHKNANSDDPPRELTLPQDLCYQLMGRVSRNRPHWLLHRDGVPLPDDGMPSDWPLAMTNQELRTSYTTWLINDSGYDDYTQDHWHKVLGHKRPTALAHYNAGPVPIPVTINPPPQPEPQSEPEPQPKPETRSVETQTTNPPIQMTAEDLKRELDTLTATFLQLVNKQFERYLSASSASQTEA